MSDLFPDLVDAHFPGGFRYAEALIESDTAWAMIALLSALTLAPFRFQGWLGKRHTASFGWRYDFDDGSFRPGEPLPDFLFPLREHAAAFAGLPADDLVQALVTRYDPGAGIGWHRDRPVFEHVIGISFGAPATLRFRRRRASGGFDRAAAPLAPGSAYHLTGTARHEWEHSIAPMAQQRWSVTFRTLSEKGRRAAGAGTQAHF
jgi:DNA oxidative demethylase